MLSLFGKELSHRVFMLYVLSRSCLCHVCIPGCLSRTNIYSCIVCQHFVAAAFGAELFAVKVSRFCVACAENKLSILRNAFVWRKTTSDKLRRPRRPLKTRKVIMPEMALATGFRNLTKPLPPKTKCHISPSDRIWTRMQTE